MAKTINKVVIVGGGTAGWMTAAAIVSALPRDRVRVQLVESEAIGIIGVGEATLPHLRNFNENLGVDETEFMRETSATFKLGIEFANWARAGDAYIHPFGAFGLTQSGAGFHHYWRRLHAQAGDIGNYSLPIAAARRAKFAPPAPDSSTLAGSYGYAYHFDSAAYAPFLRRHAEQRGARRTEGKVVSVDRDPETGDILALTLESGERLAGDLFIDCTGFSGLLIEKTLHAGYERWTQWLPCDRAIAMQSESNGPLLPYTRATADTAGWRWRIPLQHRTGNGHVYSSEFTTDDAALAALQAGLDAAAVTEPKLLRFTTGKRKRMWHHNCIAIGLAGGFLEPLESTSIYLIQSAITNLVELFPVDEDYALERDEYNRILDNEFTRVRDFLILHYHASERRDSPFWDYVRTMSIPDSLHAKIELFRASGRVANYRRGLFLEPSWIAVYLGQRIIPDAWDQRANAIDKQQLIGRFDQLRAAIERTVDAMPDHGEYVAQFCPAAQEVAA